LRTDVVLAWRSLRKTPGLSGVALLCLAIAMGVATAAFSVIHGALLSTLPVPHGHRLVMVHDIHRVGGYNVQQTAAQFTHLRGNSTSFDALGAWYSRNVTLSAGPGAEAAQGLVRAAYVSADSLDIVGVAPVLGRLPRAGDVEPESNPVVVLGYDIWRGRLASDSDILGRDVYVSGRAHTVIGVMPGGYRFPIRDDLWIPVQLNPAAGNASAESLTLFGRLKEGVSRQQAAAELTVLSASDRARTLGDTTSTLIMPFARGFMTPEQEWAIYAFILGLMLFLTVVAGNLANLFFARNSARLRDIAVQSALGASRRRLMVPLLLESLMLAAGAALAGLALAQAILAWFRSAVEDLPWWADFELDPIVLGFLAVSALLASSVAGVGPAVRLTRVSVAASLPQSGTGGSGLRFSRIGTALIVVQVAVSVAFLSVVGVLAQALFGFRYEKYSIAGQDLLIAQVYLGPPPASELADAPDRRQVFQRHYARSLQQFVRITARLREQPGVGRVTFASHFPGNDVESIRIEIESRTAAGTSDVMTRIASVGPDFFDTLDANVVYGRDFEAADHEGPLRTVIVNEPFARKYFSQGTPLGNHLRLRAEPDSPPGPWLEIVGVVPDLALNPGDPGRADGIYVPFGPSNFARLAVRTESAPAGIVPHLHDIVLRENPRAQVQSAGTLEAQMNTAGAVFRGLGAGLLVIGGTALLLSTVSLYSLVSFGVARRTREIGIRLALGASRGRILQSVLRRELTVVFLGSAVGLALGAGLYQLVALVPFDLRPAGPSLLMAFIGLMVLVGGGACLVPARRALWVEPVEALRHE
jgi:predicted permease